VKLADYTTLGLGGPAGTFVAAATDDELMEAVSVPGPVLILGGGSNLVVADDGFPGTVVHVATRGIRIDGTEVTAAAGEPWDAVVQHTIEAGLAGLECLSGIPGLAGATPIQNVGAYGQEVADTIRTVRVYDRKTQKITTYQNDLCCFAYRTSMFRGAERYLILDVTFDLSREPAPIRYGELATRLPEGASPRQIREAVLPLRRSKGMVIDPADPDTRNCGSFFTNPIVPPGLVPPGAPHFAAADGLVKVPAAWLIEQAGFHRGYPGPDGVRISAKHTLALVNDGNGSTVALLALAREIRDGVRSAFGIELHPEPILVGATL
jgi:UDP-N-acetylmuramate dehydrogenase